MEENKSDLDVHGLDEIIRDFLVLRVRRVSHLTIPAFLENYVTESLKEHIPYLEVRDPTSCYTASLILLQIHQGRGWVRLPNVLSSRTGRFLTAHI